MLRYIIVALVLNSAWNDVHAWGCCGSSDGVASRSGERQGSPEAERVGVPSAQVENPILQRPSNPDASSNADGAYDIPTWVAEVAAATAANYASSTSSEAASQGSSSSSLDDRRARQYLAEVHSLGSADSGVVINCGGRRWVLPDAGGEIIDIATFQSVLGEDIARVDQDALEGVEILDMHVFVYLISYLEHSAERLTRQVVDEIMQGVEVDVPALAHNSEIRVAC